MPRKKKVVENVPVVDIADRGKSIAKDAEGKVYLLNEGVPGDTVDILVKRKKKSMFLGHVLKYQSLSADRIEPRCQHFGVCGGCKWQHMDYQAQLQYKEKTVVNALTRIGGVAADIIRPIIGSTEIFEYRNKLEYSFSNKRWLTTEEIATEKDIQQTPALGFHAPGSFDKVVDIIKCHLQDDLTNAIRNHLREYAFQHNLPFYDARKHVGYFRNVILRNNRDGKWMIILSVAQDRPEVLKGVLDSLIDAFPQITTLYYVINKKKNDTILDLDIILYHGDEFLIERLKDIKYRIGPKSFFQTNTRQAERLFDITAEYAAFKGSENVYDLYTGLGSIALYISKHVGHVTGIEEVEAAIDEAKINAELNGIKNTTFYAGDVKDILTEAFVEQHGSPDVVITDPPRAGMHPDVVDTLLKLEAPRIVYVSCNPATQARDLSLLNAKYVTIAAQPVDMFPHTHHIENVALLELRQG